MTLPTTEQILFTQMMKDFDLPEALAEIESNRYDHECRAAVQR